MASTATTVIPARSRVRNLQLDTAVAALEVGKPTPEMKKLATSFFSEGKASNKAKSAADKARKLLYALMKDEKINGFDFSAVGPDGKLELSVTIGATTSDAIDPKKLYDLMEAGKSADNLKKFLEVVSATKGSVEKHLGTAAIARLVVPTTGDENVHVKPKK